MFKFRQDALKQDRSLKERCSHYLGEKGIRLPNTCITIKQEKRELFLVNRQLKSEPVSREQPSTSKLDLKEMLHPSITQLYQAYPLLKLPKTCVDRHMAPVVSMPMGEVEKYFKRRKLDMKQYIFKARARTQSKGPSNSVAKKRTSLPTKSKKTVAPLKISKKLFGNYKETSSSLNSYVCIPANELKAGRKRSVSSSDTDRSSKAKIIKESESQTAFKHAVINTEENMEKLNSHVICESVTPLTLPPPPTIINPLEPPIANMPVRTQTPIVDFLEESRDSIASNISVRTTSSTESQPDFLESFGLTPTVTATKTQTLLVCNVCGSVHNNAFELKRHSAKHMVCQFCKRRFKSFDAKQDHIDIDCEVKNLMISSGPAVSLEKIHLNLDIRKKYKEAFKMFEPIPGLQEPAPVEEVIVRSVSPPPLAHLDNVIVLSDDDDVPSADPLSGIPTHGANISLPAVEAVVYNTVSIVKPDVRIKNNAILSECPPNINDKRLLRELLKRLKPKNTTVEKMLQTDLPASKDIKINNSEGTCEFKNLKEQLLTYKVPITINNGFFHVGYQFKNKRKPTSKAAQWYVLPLIDKRKKTSENARASLGTNNASGSISPPAKTNPPNLSVIASNSQQQPTVPVISVASAMPPPLTPTNPSASSIQLPKDLSCAPVSNSAMNSVNSNSATPLLQNYALSIAPSASIVNKPLPIPKTFVNSAINNRNNNNPGFRSSHPANRNGSPSNSLQVSFSNPNSAVMTIPGTHINPLGLPPGYNRFPPNYIPNVLISTQAASCSTVTAGNYSISDTISPIVPNYSPNNNLLTTSAQTLPRMQPSANHSTTTVGTDSISDTISSVIANYNPNNNLSSTSAQTLPRMQPSANHPATSGNNSSTNVRTIVAPMYIPSTNPTTSGNSFNSSVASTVASVYIPSNNPLLSSTQVMPRIPPPAYYPAATSGNNSNSNSNASSSEAPTFRVKNVWELR